MEENIPYQISQSLIQYVALLEQTSDATWPSVPPSELRHPILQMLNELPQNMMQFVYGIKYFSLSKSFGLNLGYHVVFVHINNEEDIIRESVIQADIPTVFLMCTDNHEIIKKYSEIFSPILPRYSLCICPSGCETEWIEGATAVSKREEIWQWFYNYAFSQFSADKNREPYTVPIFQESLYDLGHVFSPSLVNTAILNSIEANWGYVLLSHNIDVTKAKLESSNQALQNPNDSKRQELLVSQIERIRDLETMALNTTSESCFRQDIYYAPLLLALPYNSRDLRVKTRAVIRDKDVLKHAKFINYVVNYYQKPSYIHEFKLSDKISPLENYEILQNQGLIAHARTSFLDFVGSLHCSIKFSPYLRLPIMGSNINAELSFVGHKNLDKLDNSHQKYQSIRKVMEKVGLKIAQEACVEKTLELIHHNPSQIVAITDLPIEWLMADGVPLGFSHDVCRIPENPLPSVLAQYVEAQFRPYEIPEDILRHTLVVFGNEDGAFVTAQEMVLLAQQKCGFIIRKCLNKEAFFEAIEEVNPQFLIIDSHGGVDDKTHQSYINIGNDIVNGTDIVERHVKVPLVFLSACVTAPTYNMISTIANAFFEAGSSAVTTSYMHLSVIPATMLYTRLLFQLDGAAKNGLHYNWLSFVSHILRTSYIQAPYKVCKGEENCDRDSIKEILASIQADSMVFSKRSKIYKNLNMNSFTKRMGADYHNIIPHYLMYSTLGRADLIRFEAARKNLMNNYTKN